MVEITAMRTPAGNYPQPVRPPGLGLVSVLVPTFNGERYLADALRSAVTQTYEDLEIVVSDDGSTDQTVEIARAFADEDDRVRVEVNQGHLGPVCGRQPALLARDPGAVVRTIAVMSRRLQWD
jgi:glycosyltransferase involved in cell wall biosynthesis